jgi:hypothetical protein
MAASAELIVAILGVIVTVPSAILVFVQCRRNRHEDMVLPVASSKLCIKL